MFSLHDLPDSVRIDGVEYGIDMSFDNIIRLHEVFMSDLEQAIKVYTAINLLFEDELEFSPQEQIEAFEAVYKELVVAEGEETVELDLLGNPMPKLQLEEDEEEGAEYCIVRDMEFIYPSFLQDYRMDLLKQRGKMHWWTFKTLLSGLGPETKFKQVLDIRQRPLKGKGKEIEELRKLKKHYALKPYGKAVRDEGSTMQQV